MAEASALKRIDHWRSEPDPFEVDDAVFDCLQDLADEHGYIEKGETRIWLEWSESSIQLPDDSVLAQAFRQLRPFEPFVYPSIHSFPESGATQNLPEPAFLSSAQSIWVLKDGGSVENHLYELARRLELDGNRFASPADLGWLTSYRDALAFEINRCAERLTAPSEGSVGGKSLLIKALAVLKVWLAEAIGAVGPQQASHVSLVAVAAWESFKRGTPWDANGWISPSAFESKFEVTGLSPAVIVSTFRGLGYYASIRDRITAPAYTLWPRLQAAETLLHAALMGTAISEKWIEGAVQDANAEDKRKEALREVLLDARSKYRYVEDVLRPQAEADKRARSLWGDIHKLFVEAWTDAGLSEDARPHATPDNLKDAISEWRRRERSQRGGRGSNMG